MSYGEMIEKIGVVITAINNITDQMYKEINTYSNNKKNRKRDGSLKKYQYEFERDNYNILKCRNKIKRGELFKKRCIAYKDYLMNIKKKDIINIKKSEYAFIKIIQEEVIYYFNSKEEELKQRLIIEKICERDPQSLEKLKVLEKQRDEKYDLFLNKQFIIDENKLYTLDYLNYEVIEAVDLLYDQKKTKKSNKKK